MKRIVLPGALVLACAALAWAAPPAMTGKWDVHISVSGYEGDLVCTFAQAAANLTGTCVTDQGTSKLTGTVNGTALTWSYDSQYQGSPITVTYTATLSDPGKIAGAVEVDPFGVSGDFTAVPAPAAAAAAGGPQ